MSFAKTSRASVAALAALFVLSLTLLTVAFITPAEAATCTDGSTRWVSSGCCECNSGFFQKLYACDNGTWYYTGYSQCVTSGSCCAYPCCI